MSRKSPFLTFIFFIMIIFLFTGCQLLDNLLGMGNENKNYYEDEDYYYPSSQPDSNPTPYPQPSPDFTNIPVDVIWNEQTVEGDQEKRYLVSTNPGESYTVSLTDLSGNIDLYVCSDPLREYGIGYSCEPETYPEVVTNITGFPEIYIIVESKTGYRENFTISVSQLTTCRDPQIDQATGYLRIEPETEYCLQFISKSQEHKYYVLYANAGATTEIYLEQMQTNLDLYIFDEYWNQISSSNYSGLTDEHVYGISGYYTLIIDVYNYMYGDSSFKLWVTSYSY